MNKSLATATASQSSSDCAVKVAVRERPRMPSDSTRASLAGSRSSLASGHIADDEPTERAVIERVGSLQDNIIVVGDRPFVFDAVLGPEVGQQQLYEELVQPLVDRLLGGFFCTVLAYGQTGTGKSYTMGLHTEAFADDQGGVVPRTLRDIFGRVHASNATGCTEATLAISFIEIYNEKVIDLLLLIDDNAENTAANIGAAGPASAAAQRPTKSQQSRCPPATRRPVRTAAEALRVLADGNRQRHVRPTKMNAQSSRSHAICTVHATVRAANRHTVSAMHLVDLAGSEGVRRTGAQGAALAEGVHINQGLLSIGKVLQALSSGQRVVPYRDSVLSSVLQDSLNANAFLTLLACISPLAADLSETLSTLRFANGAKALRLTPQVNAIVADIKRTRTPAKLPKTPNKHLLPVTAAASTAAANASPSASPCRRPGGKAQRTPLLGRKSLFAHSTAVRPANGVPGARRPFGTPGRTQLNRTVAVPQRSVQPQLQPQQQQRQRTTTAASNETLRLCDESEMFLNVSTSTVFEQATPVAAVPRVAAVAAAAAPVQSFSPLVRRCVQEVEQSLGQQFRALMQSFAADATLKPIACAVPMAPMAPEALVENEAATSNGDVDGNVIVASVDPNSGGPADQTVVASELRRSKRISRLPQEDDMTGRTINNISWNTLTRGLRQIVRDELITMQANTFTGTTVDNTTTQTAQPTISPPPPGTTCDSTMPTFKVPTTTTTQPKAIKMRRQTLAAAPSDPPPANCRRSVRQSILRRRQTIDEMAIPPPAPQLQPLPPAPVKRRRMTVSDKQTTAAAAIEQLATVSGRPKKRQQHSDFVLGLFNTGTLRELQILPQVGPKLAYQIIMHRSSSGKLRNLAEMAAMPIWRGKSWERFRTLNCLN